MTAGEFFTKVAIVLTVTSAAMENLCSTRMAATIGGVLVAASCLRDANIRWREAVRMFPGFGFWFFVTAAMICPPNAILKKLIGRESWGLTYWGSVFAAGFIAMFFRGFAIMCESMSRWTMWFLGFDNKRLDAAHRYLMGEPYSYDTSDEDDEEDYDAFFQSSDSDVIIVDGDCCPNANDHRPRLN